MEQIPEAEVERLMRVREVMLQAMSKKITWWQAAEIMGVSVRTMRRWKWQYEQHGFRGDTRQEEGQAELAQGSDGGGESGSGPVPGAVLRPERAPFSREASRPSPHA